MTGYVAPGVSGFLRYYPARGLINVQNSPTNRAGVLVVPPWVMYNFTYPPSHEKLTEPMLIVGKRSSSRIKTWHRPEALIVR